MSGIVGLFNLDGCPVEPSDLKRLAAASRHRAVDGEDFWIGSSVGIGHQHFRVTPESLSERQPLVSPSGIVVAFDGRLDNRQEIIAACASGVPEPADASDATLALAAYERFGEEFAVRLNGDFALALFDPIQRCLLLARDRMGGRSLYYCQLPRTLLFASEIKSLLAHPAVPTRPDEDALADLVLDGYCDGRTTCFQNVSSVPPGHLLVVRADGCVLHQHWDFDPTRQIQCRSFDEYVEAFRSLFAESVRRRLRSAHPIAVSVSGGVDSSSIFCQAAALVRSGAASGALNGTALTFFGDPHANEIEYLDQVEAASRLQIARQPVSDLRLLTDAEDLIWHSEMPGLTWDAQSALVSSARQSGSSVLLDGFGGDQMLFERAYLLDLARRGRWLKVRHDLREFAAWMTDVEAGVFESQFQSALVRAVPPRWLFRVVKNTTARRRSDRRHPRWYTTTFLERARERSLSRPMLGERAASHHAAEYYRNVTSGFYQTQLQRTNGVGLMHNVEVAHPFLDRDLVAFLMAIPGEVVNRAGVPKALLRHGLQGILPEAVRHRRSKADFTAVTNRALIADYPGIRRLLTRDCRSVQAGFVDGDRLSQELSTFEARVARSETAIPGWQLSDLVSLEIWLGCFFGAAS